MQPRDVRSRGSQLIALLALMLAVQARVHSGFNGYYEIFVTAGGAYTVKTGPLHPVPGVSVLNSATSSWNSVRSYRSASEWLLGGGVPPADPGFTCTGPGGGVRWDTPILDAGGRQTGVQLGWVIQNGTDDIDIVHEVNVEGSTYADSAVRVTTCVANHGVADAEVGIRFLWDLMIADEDGPYIGPRPPGPPAEPYLDVEQDFPSPAWSAYDVSDQPRPLVTPSTYTVGGSVNRLTPALVPTPPELVQYAGWPGPANTCFDYVTMGRLVGSNDSAMTYYWGATPATAIRVPLGETWCATEYLLAFPAITPPLCDLAPALAAGAPTCGTPVTLDASSSFSADCAGPLEYRFSDPSGVVVEDWSTDPFATATDDGAWTVDVRCSTEPSCTESEWTNVRIDRVPTLTASASLIAPCDQGVDLSWSATFNGSSGSGVVNIYRSTIDCADAVARPPFLANVAGTSIQDLTTMSGQTYWYVVEAEDATAASPCSPQGGSAGGAATRVCLGPFNDTFDRTPPARICWPLRVGHAGDAALLDWSTVRALLPGEHFHVMKTTLDPRNPFVRVNGEGDVAVAYSETDVSTWLHFFDVRVTDDCEIESADDEPPFFGGPPPTCP